MHLPRISHGSGATLFDTDGGEYVDLFSANGVAWLGHAEPKIAAAVRAQLKRLWTSGRLPTEISERALAELEAFLPTGYRVAGLYSTGAEALEFAARVARVAKGRNGVAGFARSMHGKTALASYLGWDNGDRLQMPDCARLPYPPESSEEEALAAAQAELSRGATAAVCFEPIQGSGGGFAPSDGFVKQLREVTAAHDALLLFDELMTGLYRTGPRFAFEGIGVEPDLVLIGKSLGNGFPVSAVAAREPLEITPPMLPGSTFAGNPLAAAAVCGSLQRMREHDLPSMVAGIERTISSCFASIEARGFRIRGKGAFWVLTMPAGVDMQRLAERIYGRGVAIGFAGRQIRLLPPVVIGQEALRRACETVREEVAAVLESSSAAAGAT